MALVLLGIFLSSTSYKYGWDDQHLEIPLLKSLIDDNLYRGDYYVESLKKNFLSYFYPILARFITVSQIPTAYFFLYLISRYFLFFWIYKIWLHISNDPFKALACSASLILILRVNEFLYRTFSHQEFTLPIIFAGIYFFFKERYVLAALILGCAANFHALYSLFPFIFMETYLLLQIHMYGWRPLIKTTMTFILASLPFLIWLVINRLGVHAATVEVVNQDWLSLFILACPQNFIFPSFPQIPFSKLISNPTILYQALQPFIFVFALFLLNIVYNKDFKRNKKAIIFCLTAFDLLIICLIFTYFFPNKFIINLNLTRSTQFLLFILIGYTVLLVMNNIEKGHSLLGFGLTMGFVLLKLNNQISLYGLGFIFLILSIQYAILKLKDPSKLSPETIAADLNSNTKIIYSALAGLYMLGALLCLYMIVITFNSIPYGKTIKFSLSLILILLIIKTFVHSRCTKEIHIIRSARIFILIPLVVFMFQFVQYRQQRLHIENYGGGFWDLQRNWEDIQKYAKTHTPKNALILVPYNMEMGGFRILSERKIICSYRDCGIIGFDYNAAVEWKKRVDDIKPFTFNIKESPLKAIQNAILKYKADYVVFMRNVAPTQKNEIFAPLYSNKYFSLFKVTTQSGLKPYLR